MQTQKRVIDASRNYRNEANSRPVIQTRRIQTPNGTVQIPRSIHPPSTYVPRYNVSVHPTANMIVEKDDTPEEKEEVQETPIVRGFNIEGCKTIEEVYEKNKHMIKIVPE